MKLTVLFYVISLQELETKEITAKKNYFMSTRQIRLKIYYMARYVAKLFDHATFKI